MTNDTTPPNPGGLCMCGCGRTTSIARRTITRQRQVRGERVRYISGHNRAKSGPEYRVDENGCWVWLRFVGPNGYGQLRDRATGRRAVAHRLYYERVHGPIPEGLQLDHLCRNRACVNPAHMEAITCGENIRRGANTKLTDADVRDLKSASAAGVSRTALAHHYGLTACYVSNIVGPRARSRR